MTPKDYWTLKIKHPLWLGGEVVNKRIGEIDYNIHTESLCDDELTLRIYRTNVKSIIPLPPEFIIWIRDFYETAPCDLPC